MGKPTGYTRRALADWADLPLPISLGILKTELAWAVEDGDVAEEAKLRAEIKQHEDVIAFYKTTPAKTAEGQ